MRVNVRLGAWHLMCDHRWRWSVHHNRHWAYSFSWPSPAIVKGEFSRPGDPSSWFRVYRLFGIERKER